MPAFVSNSTAQLGSTSQELGIEKLPFLLTSKSVMLQLACIQLVHSVQRVKFHVVRSLYRIVLTIVISRYWRSLNNNAKAQ